MDEEVELAIAEPGAAYWAALPLLLILNLMFGRLTYEGFSKNHGGV